MLFKEFKIRQLSNEKEYVIYEYIEIFGFLIKTKYYSSDGIKGNIPFTYEEVELKINEFEQLEEFECVYREGTFSFIIMLLFAFISLYYILS